MTLNPEIELKLTLSRQTVAVGVIKSVIKSEKAGGKVTKAAVKASGKK